MNKLPYRQVHLDFHTPELPFRLGKDFNKGIFQERLMRGHINSITLTARCHHGHIYYDSRLPARHPQMEGDFLMELVDACHEIGVRCPIYITAGWDSYSADRHPEWLERQADGSIYGFENFGQLEPGWKTLCFNTGYMDYLLEQTAETIEHFIGKLDGLFFDIIRQDPCCCNCCMEKMEKEGYDPRSLEDRKNFGLQTKIRFKETMTRFISEKAPDCPVFYNEGNITPAIRPNLGDYSHLEIESLASGDWGYQHFPVVVRYGKNLGKEYLGMTGKFQRNWADFGSYKNQAALEYECFLALAHGAKCSIGDQMYGDGALQEATYNLIGAVYGEVEKLEPWVRDCKAVTEIAVLHPNLYEPSKEKVDLSLAGAVNMFNEAHIQFDIIDDTMDFTPYKVIVLPDKLELKEELADKLDAYGNMGGKILATYQSGKVSGSVKSLKALNLEYAGEAGFEPMYAVFTKDYGPALSKGELVLHGKGMYVKSLGGSGEEGQSEDVRMFGRLWEPMYNRTYQHYYSHYQAPISKPSPYPLGLETKSGIYLAHEYFSMYKTFGAREYKEIILKALEHLMGERHMICSNAPVSSDVLLNYQPEEKRLVLHYLHYIPRKKAIWVETIEEATPVWNTGFELDMAMIADRLNIELPPVIHVGAVRHGAGLPYTEVGGKLTFTLPELDGYELVEIKF